MSEASSEQYAATSLGIDRLRLIDEMLARNTIFSMAGVANIPPFVVENNIMGERKNYSMN